MLTQISAVIDKAWGALDYPLRNGLRKPFMQVRIFFLSPNPQPIINAVHQGLVEEEQINRSASYMLTEMMKLGLFDNPYVDPEEALTVANNPDSQAIADDAHRRSVVLLRNEENFLPLRDDAIRNVRLYVEKFPGGKRARNRSIKAKN